MSASDDDLDEIELEPEAADSDMRAEPQIEREREREASEDNGGQRRRSRRRGRRGGRHQRGRNGEGMSETRAESSPEDFASAHDAGGGPAAEADESHGMDAGHRLEPEPSERRSEPIIAEAAPAPEAKESPALPAEEGHDFRRKEPAPSHGLNGSGKPNGKTHAAPEPVVGGEGAEPDLEEAKAVDVRPSAPPPPPKPRGTRRGWWQKR
jgi:ribonuclease E